MSVLAVPVRISGVEPSPQLTVMDDIVPSLSVAVKVTVTGCPALAGFGETLVSVTTGGLSLTVSDMMAEPVEPPLSVTASVIVKLWLAKEPVEAYV